MRSVFLRRREAALRRIPRSFLVFAIVALSAWQGAPARAAVGDWPGYLFGPRHSSANVDAPSITAADVPNLAPDWTFRAPAPQPGQPFAGFVSSPTVADGRVFIGSNTGVFYAVDETTGGVLWSRDLGHATAMTCSSRGIASTATVAFDTARGENVVYVGGGDGYLWALAADDGSIVWRSFVVDIGATRNKGYNWSSPIVVNGHVYMGVSSQCDQPLVRGGIKEYNQASGLFENVYWTVPKGSIGGSVWTSPASKGPNVWIATGNAEPGGTPGDSFAIVRLSLSLVKQELFVAPVGDDLDFGASPTLFSATIGGVSRSMIGACNKNGTFYAFTSTGLANGPVWTRRLGDFPGAGGTCLAAAIWDGADGTLIAGSNQTTINGVSVPGSLRALDPDTGVPIWKTALSVGPVMGSPSMNGAGIVAAGTYVKSAPNAVYLVDASDGTILRALSMTSPVFAQPVFAGTHLFVATNGGKLIAYAAS